MKTLKETQFNENVLNESDNTAIEARLTTLQSGKLDKTGGVVTGNITLKTTDSIRTPGIFFDNTRPNFASQIYVGDSGSGKYGLFLDSAGSVVVQSGSLEIDLTTDITSKRPLIDNECHKTEFTEWVAHGLPSGISMPGQPYLTEYNELYWRDSTGWLWVTDIIRDPVTTEIQFQELESIRKFTATRSAVCTEDKIFTTQDYVDNCCKPLANKEYIHETTNLSTILIDIATALGAKFKHASE